MELLYVVRRKALKCEPPHFEKVTDPELVRPMCTISCRNIIAFSSPTELTDSDCDTWGGHVYVCDLDTPWDSHKVVSTTYPVSALEWDGEGKQLLVATTEGEVSVYGQKEFLLNDWTCLYSATYPGEHIVKGVFFHSGRRLVAVDKKSDAPVTERIQALRAAPTLKGFGGVAIPGACVVTASGLLGALTSDGSSAAHSLRQHRHHVTGACFAHKNGSILVAAVCVSASGRADVRCCLVSLTRAAGGPAPLAPALAATPLPTLLAAHPPTCITWCQREHTDSLLVGRTGALALWKLTERHHAPHKLLAKGPLQGSTTPGGGQKQDCFNTMAWQQAAAWGVDGNARCTSVASGRTGLGPPHAVLATPRRLYLLSRDTHHPICSRAVPTCGADPPVASPPKKPKYGNGYTQGGGGAWCAVYSVDMSWLGGVAVCVDSRAQLVVYRLTQPIADIPTPVCVQHACSLLEYGLAAGYDTLDVMLTLKPTVVDAVYERFTEWFQRQPAPFQQYYTHSWIQMRIALCRLVPGAAAGASVSWLSCLSALWGLWAACGASLRHDDKLLAALTDDISPTPTPTAPEHDKALLTLESKPELPAETQVLVALRRPLQRAADTALTVLAAVAGSTTAHAHHHGYELWTDPVGVTLLRKLVVLARAAGATGADTTVSRLLARLPAQHQPPKVDLIEECGTVTSMHTARLWDALPRTAVSAPHGQPHPLNCTYGAPPDALRAAPDPPPYAAESAHNNMDSIRYMYLGLVSVWRGCSRCGARALPPPHPAKHPLQRAHDDRYLPTCRCGGKWTLVSM